jgi:hypothetical protein
MAKLNAHRQEHKMVSKRMEEEYLRANSRGSMGSRASMGSRGALNQSRDSNLSFLSRSGNSGRNRFFSPK